MNPFHIQGQQMGQIFQPGGAGYFVPTMPQAQRFYTPGQMGQVRPTPRWQAPQGVRQPGQPQTAFQAVPAGGAQVPRQARPTGQQAVRGATASARPITGQQVGVNGTQRMPVAVGRAGPAAVPGGQPRPTYKYTATMRNPPQAAAGIQAQNVQQMPPQAVHIQVR